MEMRPPRPTKAAPALPPNTYTNRWKAAFKIFNTAADGLVLTQKVVKTSADLMDVTFRKKVVAALANKDMEKAIRKAELAIPGAHLNTDQRGKLQYAVQELMSEYTQYEDAMEKVIVVQGKALTNASAVHYNQALKTLITEAKEIHKDLKQEITKARIAESDEKSREVYKQEAEQNIKRTKTAVAKAMTFISNARSANNPNKFFDDGVMTAARDITTQLGTLDKLAKQGYKFDRGTPQNLFEDLSQWANHGRKIGEGGGSDNFVNELATFEKVVRAAGDWAN